MFQTRQKDRERQRRRREKMTEREKEADRLKAKKRMREIRKKKGMTSEDDRRKNRERRYLLRHQKRLANANPGLDIFQHNFGLYQSGIHWQNCTSCNTKTMVDLYSKSRCKYCRHFRKENSMNPLEVPECLKDLSYIEKQLISRIHPVVSLYKIKSCQYGYRGNIINFPQNVQEVADILPHKVSELTNVITIRLDTSTKHHDFQVRQNAVREALLWLKSNNPLYKNINISEENCTLLPLNDNIYEQIRGYTLEKELSSEGNSDNEDGIIYTDIPDTKILTQKEQLSNSLDQNVTLWPTIGKLPVNEFSTPGYITMAFPHLFPYGKGDVSMPHESKIKLSEYGNYLMDYEDDRFAKDPRFRYFLMNTLMRWTALNCGNIFVKKNEIFSNMTIEQLRLYLKEHPNVVKQIMHYASTIRTTKPYWTTRCSELLDMVTQLGPPTVFFTFSSADFHWPDVYRLLNLNVKDLTVKEKMQLISENPKVFDTFFTMRSKYFLQNCFTRKFNVKDMWFRYEYQHRGSIHLHGVAWFYDAPSIDNISNPSVQQNILDYFDQIISCNNPDPDCHISKIHPCQISHLDIINHDEDLAELVNRVQRHTVCNKSCLTKNGKVLKKCRYNFPYDLKEKSELVIENNEIKEILFKRNDHLVNKYNPWLLSTWRGNTDFSPVLSDNGIHRYIAKYASKCEIKSTEYLQILNSITTKTDNENESCKSTIRKLLISTCAERDYSAQEVLHFLMGHAFYRSSRDFVVLNYKHFAWNSLAGHQCYKSFLQYYTERPVHLESTCLFEFARDINVRKGNYTRRKKCAIVRIFPKMSFKQENPMNDNNYEHLYAFFTPWRSGKDLEVSIEIKKAKVIPLIDQIKLVFQGRTMKDVKNAYKRDEDPQEGSSKSTVILDPLGSYHPMQEENSNTLGKRNIDTSHIWDAWQHELNIETLDLIHDLMKEKVDTAEKFEINDHPLSMEQKKVFEYLREKLQCIDNPSNQNGCLTVIQGGAGTGKSYLLKRMYNYIVDELGPESVLLMAPTGTAAKLINGSTIHSMLNIDRNFSRFRSLIGDDLKQYQNKFQKVKIIFIDEYSMLGGRLLAAIEDRLRQMKDSSENFGNLLVFLFGDCHQLVPSGDTPVFAPINVYSRQAGNLAERGKLLIRTTTRAFLLSTNYRTGKNEYSDFLARLSVGECNKHDLKCINDRCLTFLSQKDRKSFKGALHICPTNTLVDNQNLSKLKGMKKPVAICKALNNNVTAFKSSLKKANGLLNTLYICEGSKVMLRRNINVSRGLVNGSVGTIYKILYEPGRQPPMLPRYVLVKFDNVDISDLGVDYVPIRPVISFWTSKKQRCTRVQLPLCLSWAITIHKSQGMGVSKMILETTKSEFSFGLLYTALSRVSNFSSLCLIQPFTLKRLNAVKRSSHFLHVRNFMDMLNSRRQ